MTTAMIRAITGRGLPALLAAFLSGALLAGCGLDVEVDHAEATTAPKPLADRGPQAGSYKQAWRVDAPSGKQRPSYRLASGNLLLATKSGVYGHDARSGKPAWHYHEPGREVWSIAESDGAIVLHTYKNVQEDGGFHVRDQHLVGLDAATGERLWESTKEWTILADRSTSSSTPLIWGDAAGGVVAVEAESPFERAGIEARTGKKLWQVSDDDVAEECKDKTGAAGTGPIVVTRLSCGVPDDGIGAPDDAIVALDARSGELRWRRKLPSMSEPSVETTTRDGVTLWDETHEPPLLLGPDGKELFAGSAGTSCSCELLVTGGRALLTYNDDGAHKDALVSIDIRSGKATPVNGWTSTLGDVRAVAGGRMYEIQESASAAYGSGQLLPAGLSVVDAASGKLRLAPLPFASPFYAGTPGRVRPSSWLGVAGERLILATQNFEPGTAEPSAAPVITSYALAGTAQPVELGGVPVSDWPDPCRLLAGLPAVAEPTGYREPGDGRTVGSVRIPRQACTELTDSSAGLISVQVLWVARTEREAAELVKGVGPVVLGDMQLVREGRVIVGVRAGNSPEIRAAVRQAVVRNLRTLAL